MQWTQVGEAIDVSSMDKNQPDYNGWTRNQQGLYVKGKSADFDLYIYRDAYSQIFAQPAANQYGTLRVVGGTAPAYLDSIHNNDWALYAGVEFGGKDYYKKPISMEISASCASSGGTVEIWLDSIDTGTKIAECSIENTGGWNNFQSFTSDVDSVSGMHDIYLKFLGTGNLFRINWFKFIGESYTPPTSVDDEQVSNTFTLNQNYPNPFNPSTVIKYRLTVGSNVQLKIYDLLGREVAVLVNEYQQAGSHSIRLTDFGAYHSSGVYFYTLKAGSFIQTRKMILIR